MGGSLVAGVILGVMVGWFVKRFATFWTAWRAAAAAVPKARDKVVDSAGAVLLMMVAVVFVLVLVVQSA